MERKNGYCKGQRGSRRREREKERITFLKNMCGRRESWVELQVCETQKEGSSEEIGKLWH